MKTPAKTIFHFLLILSIIQLSQVSLSAQNQTDIQLNNYLSKLISFQYPASLEVHQSYVMSKEDLIQNHDVLHQFLLFADTYASTERQAQDMVDQMANNMKQNRNLGQSFVYNRPYIVGDVTCQEVMMNQHVEAKRYNRLSRICSLENVYFELTILGEENDFSQQIINFDGIFNNISLLK